MSNNAIKIFDLNSKLHMSLINKHTIAVTRSKQNKTDIIC